MNVTLLSGQTLTLDADETRIYERTNPSLLAQAKDAAYQTYQSGVGYAWGWLDAVKNLTADDPNGYWRAHFATDSLADSLVPRFGERREAKRFKIVLGMDHAERSVQDTWREFLAERSIPEFGTLHGHVWRETRLWWDALEESPNRHKREVQCSCGAYKIQERARPEHAWKDAYQGTITNS